MASGTPPPPSPAPPPPLPPPSSPPSIPSHLSPHSLRLKRGAHLGSRRCGPSTPVPSWKLYENPFYENLAAVAAAHQHASANPDAAGRHLTVSARKLAASLWELHEIPVSFRAPPKHTPPHLLLRQDLSSPAGLSSISTEASPCSHLQQRPSPTSTSDSPQTIKCSSIRPAFKQIDVPKKSPQSKAIATKSPQAKTITVMRSCSNGRNFMETDADSGLIQSTITYESPLRMDAMKRTVTPVKYKLGEAGTVSCPNELLKVLNRLRSLEDQQSTSVSLVTALRMELEHAHARVQELEFFQKSAREEIDNLLRKVAEERTLERTKEQERVKSAIQSLREEVEDERKARRKLETVNRRLTKDVSESNKALAKAVDEIERERKAREMVEDVCGELAKEIGQDKAEVEQLKREHAEVREQVDEERKMLQMAEVWREERVQMKLAEARLELEEKNMALDKLKNELQTFLNTRGTSDGQEGGIRKAEILRDAVDFLQKHEAQETYFHEPESDEAASNGDKHSIRSNKERVNSVSDFNSQGNSELEENSEPDRNRQWIRQRHPPRKRWQPAAMNSHGSRAHGLDRLGENQLDEGNYADDESHMEAGSEADGGSEGEYTSECKAGERDGSDWSADCDENEDEQEESSPWNSVTEVEEGDDANLSSDFSQGRSYRKRETCIRDKDGRYSQGIWRMGFNVDESFKMVPNKEEKFAIHIENLRDFQILETRPAAGSSSPMQKLSNGLESPGSKSQQGSSDAWNPHVTRGMKGLVEWPKGFRSNSLQAKLLEARMESQSTRPKHLLRFKYKK